MVKRRRRDLDLPAREGIAVFGDDAIQDFELHLPQHSLVGFGEPTAALDERAHARVRIQVGRIDPRQLVPHLQIADILHGVRRGAFREQLGVSRVDVDHPLTLGVKEVHPDEVDLGGREIGRGLQAELECAIVRAVPRERVELHE